MRTPLLVTRDNDFLDLMHDGGFRTEFPDLAIIAPTTFLVHVRAQIAEELGYE
jgi:hypothetical protein